ncbi:hypothetical protein [Arthrobacter burdickii]|uniref:Uncharacterized protein n=1 Tax=Arthrobacter burdickii TaxID=3035920 RepID=A0ABT8K3U6_9MICC|nr:hypothetical protein [Arthrobacter burdickii]MDN4611722.1 hypothetical protein [Arthrobacter burdickii]
MPPEIAIATIAAGSALAGSLLAVLVGLITANISRRTVLEDRTAATEADAQRWELAQKAEYETWLRNKKQEVITDFLRSADRVFSIAKAMNSANPRRQRPAGDREGIDALNAVSVEVLALLALNSVAADAAQDMMLKLGPLLLFLEENPGRLTEPLNQEFQVVMGEYMSSQGVFIAMARLDLGISQSDKSIEDQRQLAALFAEVLKSRSNATEAAG